MGAGCKPRANVLPVIVNGAVAVNEPPLDVVAHVGQEITTAAPVVVPTINPVPVTLAT